MPPMSRRDKRLQSDYEALQKLASTCLHASAPEPGPRFEFQHNGYIDSGEYPDTYTVHLRVHGMQPGFPPTDRYDHTFVIYLQGGVGAYPTSPPIVQWHTPIFHPNIITPKENDAEIQELARLLAVDVKALPERMREDEHLARLVEELKGFVCLDVLSANWSPWIGLDAVVIEIANMVRFKTYNLDSVLDHAAEKWTRERQMAHALPLETVGLTEMQETEIGALLLARGV